MVLLLLLSIAAAAAEHATVSERGKYRVEIYKKKFK
jgi:CBS domain containing-hemolysin-like protein